MKTTKIIAHQPEARVSIAPTGNFPLTPIRSTIGGLAVSPSDASGHSQPIMSIPRITAPTIASHHEVEDHPVKMAVSASASMNGANGSFGILRMMLGWPSSAVVPTVSRP